MKRLATYFDRVFVLLLDAIFWVVKVDTTDNMLALFTAEHRDRTHRTTNSIPSSLHFVVMASRPSASTLPLPLVTRMILRV
jgi:hypothetical protein